MKHFNQVLCVPPFSHPQLFNETLSSAVNLITAATLVVNKHILNQYILKFLKICVEIRCSLVYDTYTISVHGR